ncbi:DUF3164 family protein [Acetobacter oeni]|uniref:Sulfate transporter n=1 Tax=Acetobacter oeni TaxID=304077 RepID=A0A511XP27_9PROT|nr:DUF3164 family protein [Acetobacter oeni]MBB3884474.1 hypothetical protein [Acetobacter oeni]NHO20408.1 DUF3164 family protein [Acetobacter oeni]GBR00505.1 hypothetical protein AA21952_0122 [Acetobacter oeni LMG 21952]GEN64713.1 sulfate transporter [Acetobacter oeni]
MREIPEGYLQDSAGRLVPSANVKPEHLLEDELVRRLSQVAESHSDTLRQFRETCFADVRAFQEILGEKYGASVGGQKGNLSLTSYDGTLRIQIAMGDTISFGPELQAAKCLIDDCLTRWTKGANKNISAIVLDAFDVQKEGKIRTDKILALRRLEIDDPDWKQAMEAISDSIRIDATKQYVRFHVRVKPDQPFRQVPLDIART